jgi:AbrB family looped-hinge helix DNA binding protein
MEATIISTKYQVVIPKKIREMYHLQPGQKLVFIPLKNSLRVVIMPPIEQGLGFLKGIDTRVDRDETDHL